MGVVELELILNYELLLQDCLGGVVPMVFYWQFMMVWWGMVEMIRSNRIAYYSLYCKSFSSLNESKAKNIV